jgi:hypothetical protein
METVPAQRNTPKTKKMTNRIKPPQMLREVWRKSRKTVNTSNGVKRNY